MSKAFTKEVDDDEPARAGRSRQASGLPPGAQNYMTADGARRLRDELDRLVLEERPRAKALADAGESAPQLADINRRIEEVQRLLRSAAVVPPPKEHCEEVRFGATVTVRDQTGRRDRYRIVGVDEVGIAPHSVSWLSATAKALLGARFGDRVRLLDETAGRDVEIVRVAYSANYEVDAEEDVNQA